MKKIIFLILTITASLFATDTSDFQSFKFQMEADFNDFKDGKSKEPILVIAKNEPQQYIIKPVSEQLPDTPTFGDNTSVEIIDIDMIVVEIQDSVVKP